MTLRDRKRALRDSMMASRDALDADCPRRGVARNRHPHRVARRIPAGTVVLLTLPYRSEWNATLVAQHALADGKTVAMPRVDPATRMLRSLADPQPRRRHRGGLPRHPRATRPLQRHRRRNDRVGARARRGVRCRRPAAWATAAGTTTGCCRCCAPRCRALPVRSKGNWSTQCRRHRMTSASIASSPSDGCSRAHALPRDAGTNVRRSPAGRSATRNRHSMTPRRIAAAALAATLTIQIYVSFATAAAAVLAPEIAREFGIETRWVGVFVGIVYGGAMFASLASGTFVERHGAIRVSQACVVLCAIGVCAMAATPASAPVLLALAAVVIGFGYGPITPASSHLLQRTAPPSRLALTFSIKQTGVPAGVALAGALLPAARAGDRVAARVRNRRARRRRRARTRAADPRPARRRSRPATPVIARRESSRHSRCCGSGRRCSNWRSCRSSTRRCRSCLTSFLVAYLTETLHWSLVPAGFALTAATLGGVAGRIGWGHVADRFLKPRQVLMSIGWLSATFGVAYDVRDAGVARIGGPSARAVVRRDGHRLERRPVVRGRAARRSRQWPAR